jgi:hypothetical protein
MTGADTQPSTDPLSRRARHPSPGCLFVVTVLVIAASVCFLFEWRAHQRQARLASGWRTCAPSRACADFLLTAHGLRTTDGLTNLYSLSLENTGVTDAGVRPERTPQPAGTQPQRHSRHRCRAEAHQRSHKPASPPLCRHPRHGRRHRRSDGSARSGMADHREFPDYGRRHRAYSTVDAWCGDRSLSGAQELPKTSRVSLPSFTLRTRCVRLLGEADVRCPISTVNNWMTQRHRGVGSPQRVSCSSVRCS